MEVGRGTDTKVWTSESGPPDDGYHTGMGIGTSIFLIAVGAILRWGITTNHIAGIRVSVVGLILVIVGIVGLVVSLLYVSIFARGRDRGYP
ncbi:MAG: hypothetical protein QOE86_2395 [Solirubrobacteraceae bacterium]|nr:hypothetical protein [Solirubrobacteraceae bacterium]